MLRNGKLDGKLVGFKLGLQDNQEIFPFKGRQAKNGLSLFFGRVPSYVFEKTLEDNLHLYDTVKTSLAKAILLEDGLYILDDTMSGDKIRSLFVTLKDFMDITDNFRTSKYTGYVFLEHGIRFEIKGIN